MLSNGTTNIDSVTKYNEYIDRCKELGMTSIAFTEHGNIFEWFHKKEAIEKAGMKYIHAVEAYLTEGEKVRDNFHCCLYAKNFDGFKELNRLVSRSFDRSDGHFYYVPRIKLDELYATTDNIIISTACLGGLLNNGTEEQKEKFISFLSKNKHRAFLEVQHHPVEEQCRYNVWLLNLHRKYGIPLIAGTDTHCLNEKHKRGREMLQKGKGVHFANESNWDLTFKTYDELIQCYKDQAVLPEEDYLEAIENTNKLADMVESFDLDKGTKYPHIYENPEKVFMQKINEGYKKHKYVHKRYSKKEVQKRVKDEFEVYKKVQAIDFMLLKSYMCEWEKKNGIYTGPGRGSVSGSMIAYLLGITQMDSMKFDLNFFRFMNPARVTNAD